MPAFDASSTRVSRKFHLLLSGTSLAWFLAAQALADRASRGFAVRYDIFTAQPLLSAVFLLFLLFVGFLILRTIGHESSRVRDVLSLPRRPTSGEEWRVGAAVGWGIILLAVLPMALTRSLHVHLWTEPRAFELLLLNLLALVVSTLAIEVVFRGYPFHQLIKAIGPFMATVLMASAFAVYRSFDAEATSTSILIAFLTGTLLCTAWLRTHGLWLPWGLHFGLSFSTGVLFGLPVNGSGGYGSVIQTRALGYTSLTGGDYGPAAAVFTILLMVFAVAVVFRLTREYAWNYTHAPIVPGGYPMDVAPPAEHVKMETAAKPPPLVQILPTTPQSRSVVDPPE